MEATPSNAPTCSAHAFKRTERHLGHRHSGADTVIIGDTLRDIATAHAAGARIVAVATGTDSVAELRAAGADIVLPDLTDTCALQRAVTEGGGPAEPRGRTRRCGGKWCECNSGTMLLS
ncbi:HAD family hydrolase [Nonomuraea ferruginea]